MIEPVVQTYACPPHIKRQVQKKQQADYRRQLKEHKASIKHGVPSPPLQTLSIKDQRDTSAKTTPASPEIGSVYSHSSSLSRTSSRTSSFSRNSANSPSLASSLSAPPSAASSPTLVSGSNPSSPTPRFRLWKHAKKLLTPPQSPELSSFALPPKALRMPEENKQLMRFCTVCASNNNRSMEAHKVLQEHGYNVESFGTGNNVRMPGPAIDKPQVYEFGTPYNQMYNDLKRLNQKLYTSNGVLKMLDRNRQLKDHPQQWTKHTDVFDVVITCQEKCFDSVCLDLLHRGAKLCRPTHVVNVEIEDNPHEAALGAKAILDFVDMVAQSGDPDSEMLEILRAWQKTHQKYPSMYQLCYA